MTNKKIVDVDFGGEKIILPERDGIKMPYDDAIAWIQRKATEEQQIVQIHSEITCSPLDGAIAFNRALDRKYGWKELVTQRSLFGDKPPVLVSVPVGNGQVEQLAWGYMKVPGIDGEFVTHMAIDPQRFILSGKVKRKHEAQVLEILELTKKILAEESIYKGKAVKINFEYQRNDVEFAPLQHCPQFMELDSRLESSLIFSDKVTAELSIALFTPIEHKDACREHGVPLKRGILLSGPYGVGKTLTANITAAKAVRNDWTFVYLSDVRDLKQGLEFAAHYAPAVLFAEDIDRVIHGERTPEMDEILNTLDGVDTKNGEIITVFTTNHVDKINPAILRMGRLDALVEMSPPDAGAAEKLVRLYARGLLEDTANLKRIAEKLAGKIPAFIREVTERAKIAAIARLGHGDIKGHVVESDLLNAAVAMEAHDNFLKPKRTSILKPQVIVNLGATDAQAKEVLEDLARGLEN